MYRIVAFDLDGTLTQHKSILEEVNRALLKNIILKYRCVLVGAGSCERIYKQINFFPVEVIGNYGMQMAFISEGKIQYYKNETYKIDEEWFEEKIKKLRLITGYNNFKGKSIEFHKSGAVTFPLLGTEADLKEKLEFDPKGEKRSKIYDVVSNEFSGFNCFIGGTSSFDIISKKYDKYLALKEFSKKNGYKKEEILYVGDDFKKGGNDEQVFLGGIDCIVVNDYRTVKNVLFEHGVLKREL